MKLPAWGADPSRLSAAVFLGPEAMHASDPLGGACGGFELEANIVDAAMPVPLSVAAAARLLVVEVKPAQAATLDRLRRLMAERPGAAIIAAVDSPSLADVRTLMRLGVADVLPLPLRLAELGPALERSAADLDITGQESGGTGRVVAMLKSRGGIGATSLLVQIACQVARETNGEGSACLLDFDLQFGNAALYLGHLPEIGMKELLEAGDRLDPSLVQTAVLRHSSGLGCIAAPAEILPLDLLSPAAVGPVLRQARRLFTDLFVDLPHDWTPGTLALVGEAERILLVTELSVPSLHQAKRQLDFLREQDLAHVPVDIVVNKAAKGLFKSIDVKDVERILGRAPAFTIAADAQGMGNALNRGELLIDVDPRSRAARDIRDMARSLTAAKARAL